ncbi:antitoxin [Spirochaetia bacterium]|nr:antitoxin [Spirochaetia bacterium]
MSTLHESDTWQLQEAKAMLSEVIKSTVSMPQIITVRGVEAAVILSMKDYRKLKGKKPSLIEAFKNRPYPELELEMPPRLVEEPREIDW